MEADSRAEKKKPQKREFEYCKVCKRNHDEGQRHKYFPSHTKSLSSFLSRFQNKITDIRFFLKNPSLLRPEHASRNRFWCVFCDSDVDELASSFACNNAINHLASADHLKNLKHFMWKYGGGMNRVDAFRISEADVAKWEKKCKSLKSEAASFGEGSWELPFGPSNDIHNELNFENMNNIETKTIHHIDSNIPNGVMPLHYHTNECQISCSGHPGVAGSGTSLHLLSSSLPANTCSGTSSWNSNYVMVNQNNLSNSSNCAGSAFLRRGVYKDERVTSMEINSQVPKEFGSTVHSGAPSPWLDATGGGQLGSTAQKEGGGNVHSGAPPPWLEATEGDRLKPVLSSFVSSSNKSGKSKLNPKRVGAAWAEKRKMEMEMEKRGEIIKNDCDPNWLPNFGRVWQSGSRKESRKEFEIEKQKQPNAQCQLEMPVTVQPYISKRMRKDTPGDSGDCSVTK